VVNKCGRDPYVVVVPPSLQFGHDESLSPIITAQLDDVSADLFVHKTVVGYGKSQQMYFATVARVVLPEALPHIVLRAKKGSAELGHDVADCATLQLEGGFQNYFSLQIEKGQEIDVLEILTPDIMQTLVRYSQQEDIEIAGSYLYCIVNHDHRTPDVVCQLVESVAALSRQIVEQITQIAPSA